VGVDVDVVGSVHSQCRCRSVSRTCLARPSPRRRQGPLPQGPGIQKASPAISLATPIANGSAMVYRVASAKVAPGAPPALASTLLPC
jgi:hypothetical protein